MRFIESANRLSINYLTNDENIAEFILDMLKENYVTPIGFEDVLNDFLRKGLQII